VADLLQVLRGTSATVTVTFQVNGVGQNLDSGLPAITLTRPDGTAGPASGTVTSLGAGAYSFVIAAQAEVTWLDYTAVGTVGGQPQTLRGRVEWLGATLFDIAEIRALSIGGDTPFTSSVTWPDAKLHEARSATLDEFEHFLGFSPVPRFAREIVDGDGSWYLLVPHLKAHRLLSVTVNGVAQQVSSYTLKPSGVLAATSGYTASGTFTAGVANVAVEYAHGSERVMGDGGNVAMLRAAMRLQPGISSTARSITTPDGVTYDLGDMAGQVTRAGTTRRFGVPAIDSWLQEWSQAGLAVA
jgi:hypothetical protein